MRFLSLTGRNMKENFRDPLVLALGVLLPIVLLILFVSIGKNAPLDIFTPMNLTPGIIVFSFGFLIMFSGTLLSKDRQSAFLTRLLTSPLSSADFILSYTVPFIPIALVQIIVGFITGIVFGVEVTSTIFPVSLVLLLTSVSCISIGLIIGSLFTENQVAGFGSILIVIISLFSGAWMDLDMIGGFFKGFSNILPFAHAIKASRAILTEGMNANVTTDLIWLAGYAVILYVGGVLAFKFKTRPK